MSTTLIAYVRCAKCGWIEHHKASRAQTCCNLPMTPFTQEVHAATRRKVHNVSPEEMRAHLEY